MPSWCLYISISKERSIISLSKTLPLLCLFLSWWLFPASTKLSKTCSWPSSFMPLSHSPPTHTLTQPHHFWFPYSSWRTCIFTPTACSEVLRLLVIFSMAFSWYFLPEVPVSCPVFIQGILYTTCRMIYLRHQFGIKISISTLIVSELNLVLPWCFPL